MSFPPTLTTRIVQGRFVTYPDGVAAKGSVRVILSTPMQGPTDDAIVTPFDHTFKFIDGYVSITLPANDDPQWTATSYRFVFDFEKDPCDRLSQPVVISRQVVIPYQGSGPIDMNDIMSFPQPPVPGNSYVLLASKGAPGGIASLDSSGKIPTAQLPASAGGAVSWNDLQDKPSTFPPTTHSHPTSEVTGLDTALTGKASTTHTHAYSTLTSIPSTFPPAPHGHSTAQITGLDQALSDNATLAAAALAAAQIGAKSLVLSAAAPVPGGTPAGTLIFRTTT
jgi:hypothetical protein